MISTTCAALALTVTVLIAAVDAIDASALNTTQATYTTGSIMSVTEVATISQRGICDVARANRMSDPTIPFAADTEVIIPAQVCDPDDTSCFTVVDTDTTNFCLMGGPHLYYTQRNDTYRTIALERFNITLDSVLTALAVDTSQADVELDAGLFIKIPSCYPSQCTIQPYKFTYARTRTWPMSSARRIFVQHIQLGRYYHLMDPIMSDGNLASTANGPMLSLEEVTRVVQKMREDQESFLQQQRDVIIQQVLASIQQSGVLTSIDTLSHSTKKTSKKEKTSSSTARLEQNLHTLVHHSLADSGLNFPHVRSTAHEARSQRSQVFVRTENAAESSTKNKQIILSRAEYEGGDASASFAVNNEGHEDDDHADTQREISTQEVKHALTGSPLRVTRRKGSTSEKRRRHRHNGANQSRSRLDIVDDDYTKFTDPVDAAFDAVRKKVDLRTLAILDRSKVLLGQVKQHSSTDGKTSFVDKLRQRNRSIKQYPDTISLDKETGIGQTLDDNNQPDPSDEPARDIDKNDKTSTHTESELEVRESNTPTIDPSTIRCDLELLQPPPKSPDNENEWENELARQILTIYATSVKAKALEKANSTSIGKQQNDKQNRGESSIGREKSRLQSASKSGSSHNRTKSLGTSCSLPAIRNSSAFKHTKQTHRVSSSAAAVHFSWEPSQRLQDGKVIINMPRVPRPIWFAGTGTVKAVWCALAEGFTKLRPQNGSPGKPNSNVSNTSVCGHRLCEEVRQLEAKKKFAQCITTLESLLVALVRARGVDELETKLWKQLVVACNAFASRCIDYQKFPAGLQLMKQAEHLIDNSILVDSTTRMELLAYLYDTYAHYYYRRRKPHAGLQYILKAHEIHSKQSSWSHLAKCRLHIANLLSFQIKHAEAMRYMASILELIEENKLEEASEGGVGGGSAQKLCLAAVCYNNLAVEQLHMREFEAASVSSANAQRLARLCLSYSNRWLSQFQATSDCIALAIATLMEDINASKETDCKASPPAEE